MAGLQANKTLEGSQSTVRPLRNWLETMYAGWSGVSLFYWVREERMAAVTPFEQGPRSQLCALIRKNLVGWDQALYSRRLIL